MKKYKGPSQILDKSKEKMWQAVDVIDWGFLPLKHGRVKNDGRIKIIHKLDLIINLW